MYSGSYVIFGVETSKWELGDLLNLQEDEFDEDSIISVAFNWDQPLYKMSNVFMRLCQQKCGMFTGIFPSMLPC